MYAGELIDRLIEVVEMTNARWKKCPICLGEGQVFDAECPLCKGTGEVPLPPKPNER